MCSGLFTRHAMTRERNFDVAVMGMLNGRRNRIGSTCHLHNHYLLSLKAIRLRKFTGEAVTKYDG